MAKKIATDKGEPEVIAKCDILNEVTQNHDEVITSVAQSSPESVSIKSMIRLIRGQQVMLDSDLAFLYGVETRRLNEQVKRNIERFPDDFMFQLTKEEFDFFKSQFAMSNITDSQGNKNLKSQIAISKWGGTRKLPYAFTRNGVAMLSSVLRSQTAVGVNVKIMRVFTAIPQLVNNNAQVIKRIFNIEQHQLETDEKINAIIEKIENFSPKVIPEQIFQTGCVWDAWSYISDLVRSAQQRIVLIDNYVDDRVLSLLTKRADGVLATIHTRYSEQFQTDLKKHNEQYPEITFVQLPHRNHDRFLIIDNKAYLLGTSVKDIGAGLCAVTELSTLPETILEMVK
ncbi:ORF6N domain-containing protein [Prevotella sp. P2-180]|uniref:ORF6N domain-containing protein n=1 Tax=Prevotella sp. P2-180 TaxID=2024224 RepID=UPI00209C17FF|nr:ORF6N domain-containing protein [Prevotella sp. P2-180]